MTKMGFQNRLNSIHARLLITGLIPLAMLSLVLGWYMISSQSKELLSNMHDTGRVASNQMASSAEFALYSGNQEMLRTLGDSVLDIPSVSGMLFYNSADRQTVRIGDIDISIEQMPADFDSGKPFFIDDRWYFYSTITLQHRSVEDYDELGEPVSEKLG